VICKYQTSIAMIFWVYLKTLPPILDLLNLQYGICTGGDTKGSRENLSLPPESGRFGEF